MNTIKLQKYFSECHIMSRRSAEAEILAGHVFINNVKAKLGDRINPDIDIVKWNNQIIVQKIANKTYIMLNKPIGYVTTLSDDKGRLSILDLISSLEVRVYPIGRLDMYSEGLLLLTDDGEIANKLMHPSSKIEKHYIVYLQGKIDSITYNRLISVEYLDGYKLNPYKVKIIDNDIYDKNGKNYSIVEFILTEGRNREIRKICNNCKIKIIKLKRISLGDIYLDDLKTGKWRYLNDKEIQYLKEL